jgi:hypothetical protein
MEPPLPLSLTIAVRIWVDYFAQFFSIFVQHLHELCSNHSINKDRKNHVFTQILKYFTTVKVEVVEAEGPGSG